MRKQTIKQKSAALADPIALATQVIQTVVIAVKEIVADHEPQNRLPPADLVPETPSPRAARVKSASTPTTGAGSKPVAAKGGLSRAEKLPVEQRRRIVKKAAVARLRQEGAR